MEILQTKYIRISNEQVDFGSMNISADKFPRKHHSDFGSNQEIVCNRILTVNRLRIETFMTKILLRFTPMSVRVCVFFGICVICI